METKNLNIRGVDVETIRQLKIKAARSGQSLQTYLLNLVAREAAEPMIEDLVDGIRARNISRVSADDILDTIDAGRARQ